MAGTQKTKAKANFSLNRPPIIEAVLDVRAELSSDFTLDHLDEFQKQVEKEFPVRQVNNKWATRLEVSSGQVAPKVESVGGINGYIFKAADGTKIVQSRLDGFTFNKLKPYSNWESFSSEAKKLWEIYQKVAKPQTITRIALRYINLIELPPLTDLKEYITTYPEINGKLPQSMSDFLMRVVVQDELNGNTAVITEVIDHQKKHDGFIPLIFDIDVFREEKISPQDTTLWQSFEKLRLSKNNIFRNSMTEKTLKLFE